MTKDQRVLFRQEGAVAIITLNRPDQRNAIDSGMTSELRLAIDRFEADYGLRIAVLAGNGPVFCAGLDLKAFVHREPRTFSLDRVGWRAS